MRWIFASAQVTCKRLLRRRGMLAMLLLLPVLCGILSGFWAAEQPVVQIRVGVAFDEENAFCASIYETLQSTETPIQFSAYPPDERAELERLVQTGELECAYILHDTLNAQSLVLQSREGVTLIKSPATVLDIYVGEVVFSALYYNSALELDVAILRDVLEMDETQARVWLEEKFAQYEVELENALEALYSFQTTGVQEAEDRSPGQIRVLHGIISVFLLVMTAYSLPALIREKRELYPRLAPGRARGYLLGTALGLWGVGYLPGAVSLLLARMVHAPAAGPLPRALLWLAVYQLSVSLIAVLLVVVLRRGEIVYGGTVFLLLLNVVLGGVLLDLGELNRFLGSLSRFFMSSYYIGGVLTGNFRFLTVPLCLCVLCVIAVVLLAGRQRSRKTLT